MARMKTVLLIRGASSVCARSAERNGLPALAPGPESLNATIRTGYFAAMCAIVISSRMSTWPAESCLLAVAETKIRPVLNKLAPVAARVCRSALSWDLYSAIPREAIARMSIRRLPEPKLSMTVGA